MKRSLLLASPLLQSSDLLLPSKQGESLSRASWEKRHESFLPDPEEKEEEGSGEEEDEGFGTSGGGGGGEIEM